MSNHHLVGHVGGRQLLLVWRSRGKRNATHFHPTGATRTALALRLNSRTGRIRYQHFSAASAGEIRRILLVEPKPIKK